MKKLIIILSALLSAGSCEKFHLSNYFRNEVLNPGGSQGGQPGSGSDTTLYLSAVMVPRNYDWRRDSAYGGAGCELMLLKNGIKAVSMPTGPAAEVSPNPSSHHIIGGHLYTEYSSSSGTVLRRDGVQVCRYDEPEVLYGILPMGEQLYTLGMERDGDAVTLRRNGEPLLRQLSASVFGGFSGAGSGPTGALYEDDGHCCFCFRKGNDCYKVVDGVMERVNVVKSASGIADMRIFRSGVYYTIVSPVQTLLYMPSSVTVMPSAYRWGGLELFLADGELWFAGKGLRNSAWHTVCAPVGSASSPSDYRVFDGRDTFVYASGEDCYCVDISGGGVKVSDPGEALCYTRDSCFFFTRSCAYAKGKTFYMALTPKEKELPPLIWKDGDGRPFDMNGYFTGMEVEVSQSN